jgi:hypothetical protein
MKNIQILIACSLLLYASCTKPSNTTNNTTTTTVLPASNPAFVVDGINDILLDHTANFGNTTVTMPLVIQYEDSVQQTVTVSVKGIPATNGGTQDGQLARGVPTFNCSLSFVYNDIHLTPLGTYPITVTCVGSISGTKTYNFNLVLF